MKDWRINTWDERSCSSCFEEFNDTEREISTSDCLTFIKDNRTKRPVCSFNLLKVSSLVEV